MTHSFMTSNSLSMQQEASKNKKSLRSCDSNRLAFYMVVIQDYEGEEKEFEVEADSFEDASAQVESLCAEDFTDIYNMQIYKLS